MNALLEDISEKIQTKFCFGYEENIFVIICYKHVIHDYDNNKQNICQRYKY